MPATEGISSLSPWYFIADILSLFVSENNKRKSLPNESKILPKPRSADSPPVQYPTIIEIRKSIPSHCFESNLCLSLVHTLKDISLVIGLYFAAEYAWNILPIWTQIVVTPAYWIIQGTVFTGIFVLGHDCGHGSYSNFPMLNDIIGTVLHSFLLVPYYAWKLSHRNHHKNTGNIDRDEVFYPVRQKYDSGKGYLPGFGLGVGWFFYLLRGYKPRQVNHLNPFHNLYREHVLACVVSIASVAGMFALLNKYYQYFGIVYFFYHFAVPEFIFASFIVIITFLHHTEEEVVWYSDNEWTYVKGQLSSIDRDYGCIHHVIHCIGTHQMHHMFTKIPHYHLEEATQHFRQAFPHLVRYRPDPILPSFVRMFRKFIKQYVIPDDTAIHIFK